MTAACTDVTLVPAHGGETLPVPDMSKLTFAQDAALAIVVSGSDESVPDTSVIRLVNTRTGVRHLVASSETGSFGTHVDGTQMGDTLQIAVLDSTRESDPIELLLAFVGQRPPVPSNIVINDGPDPHTRMISGAFVAETRPIMARLVNVSSSDVVDVPTSADGDGRHLVAVIDVVPGQTLTLFGFDPAQSRTTGPFVTIVIE
ncbi:MAG: hypothetical protein V3T05_05775 [Myxococcota bacterium]